MAARAGSYSARSDSIGLVTAARRAGIQLESSAISSNKPTAIPSVPTSRACTP